MIKQVIKLPNNMLRVLVEGHGTGRAACIWKENSEYLEAEVVTFDTEEMEQSPFPRTDGGHDPEPEGVFG